LFIHRPFRFFGLCLLLTSTAALLNAAPVEWLPEHIRSTSKQQNRQFVQLQDIALSPQKNRLYVVDRRNHQVNLLNSQNLALIKAFGEKNLRFPQDITITPNQHILVADGKQGTIVRWDVSQLLPKYLGSVRFPKKNVHSIAAIDNQTYVFLDSFRNRLALVKNDKILREVGGLGQGRQQFRNPKDVSYRHGKIFVADTGNKRILVFDAKLKPLFTLNKQAAFLFQKPNALAIDERGYLFVADEGRHIVWIFDQNYHKVSSVSYLTLQRRKLYRPSGVAVSNGQLWISSDSQNGLFLFKFKR